MRLEGHLADRKDENLPHSGISEDGYPTHNRFLLAFDHI
jgi:hypothetical protein